MSIEKLARHWACRAVNLSSNEGRTNIAGCGTTQQLGRKCIVISMFYSIALS